VFWSPSLEYILDHIIPVLVCCELCSCAQHLGDERSELIDAVLVEEALDDATPAIVDRQSDDMRLDACND
jgi:hypothetical protein